MIAKPIRVALILATLCLVGCRADVDPAELPRAEATLQGIGKRLGAKLAPERLEAIGGDESQLLKALTSTERDALARGYLRFAVDRPVVVDVAVSDARAPFWLADLAFTKTSISLSREGEHYRVWSRSYPAGTIGLGVNSLDRRVQGHYVVFVRGDAKVKLIDPDRVRIQAVETGLAAYADDARPFDSLPPELMGATALQPRRDARHDLALVRTKVWKTRVPSQNTPDQVVVSFGADPTQSLVWTWRTDPSITTSELMLESLDGSHKQVIKGDFVAIDSFGLLNDPIIHRHRVKAEGLLPDTTYRYAIRDTTRQTWTPWQTVHTGPQAGGDYSFLTMGDPQCGLEEWGTLLHKAHERHPNAGFLVIAGDLVDRGNERSNWDHFFMRAAGVFDTLPLMPCVGNHEYLDRGPVQFAGSFVLPRNGPKSIPHDLTYSFEYSDTFVAVLDSNPAVYSAVKAKVIGNWLDEQLSKTQARWKIVVFHHPVYPSHPSRATPGLGEAWIPVFDKHAVDLVLQGHDHAYLRTYPMRGHQPVTSSERGTVYVVSVSGQKFVPIADRPYAAKGFANVATYQLIDVNRRKGTLTCRAIDVDGIERDRFELHKPVSLVGREETKDRSVERSVLGPQN